MLVIKEEGIRYGLVGRSGSLGAFRFPKPKPDPVSFSSCCLLHCQPAVMRPSKTTMDKTSEIVTSLIKFFSIRVAMVMVPLYSDRIFTKTDLGAREWGVTLLFGQMWTLELWTGKAGECFKQNHASRNMEAGANKDLNCGT